MILGFLFLYLVTSDVSIFDRSTRWNKHLIDVHYDNVDLKSYCDNKPCVVKCCDYGEVIDYRGYCDIVSNYKSEYEYGSGKMDFDRIDVYSGNNTAKLRRINQNITKYLVYTENGDLFTGRYVTNEFYILQDGSVIFKIYPETQWIEAPPLRFCMDFTLNYTTVQQKHLPLTFRLAENYQSTQAMGQLHFVLAGMVISLSAITLILFSVSIRLRNTIGPIVMALIFTIAAGYLLKIVQLYALNANIPKLSECQRFSPVYYFFILSYFYWSNILIIDVWRRIRSSRLHDHDFHHKYPARFNRYCMFAWGMPFIMTLAAVAVKIDSSDKVLQIFEPPFDSYFIKVSGVPTLLYLHMPIAILMVSMCIVYSMFAFNIVMLKVSVHNSSHQISSSPQLIAIKYKVIIILKVIFGIGVIYAFSTIPSAPVLPYLVLRICVIFVFGLLFFVVIFDHSTYAQLRERIKEDHNKLMKKYQPNN